MSESVCKIAEGVFVPNPDTRNLQAINKPPYLSSAQVLRDLQGHFRSSALFASRLKWQLQQASRDPKRQTWKKRAAGKNVKIGHGGTLDPLATGVLVVGVGRGTKQMNDFLTCTKTYETVVLFGKSTDTYDVAGTVVSSASHQHVTKALVQEKLIGFRGKIKQVPPIYSALKIDGMKAYDYARIGKELPRRLEARDLEVEQCELVEWFEGGQHEYRWPATEASVEVKKIIKELVPLAEDGTKESESIQKRKLPGTLEEGGGVQSEKSMKKQGATPEGSSIHQDTEKLSQGETMQHKDSSLGVPNASSSLSAEGTAVGNKAKLHTHEVGPLSTEVCPAPAARIRVTASSGFYVRSFAHDLGIACGSLALMATLFRSRQADFDAQSALTYSDLAGGESVWGPKVQNMLDNWNERHPDDKKDKSNSSNKEPLSKEWGVRLKPNVEGRGTKRKHDRARSNTSSGED